MSESVVRYRLATGGGVDANQDPVPATWTASNLTARGVAPIRTERTEDVGRNGEILGYTLYFVPAIDIVDDDELTVRGDRCRIRVRQWRSAQTSRTGTEVVATIGRG